MGVQLCYPTHHTPQMSSSVLHPSRVHPRGWHGAARGGLGKGCTPEGGGHSTAPRAAGLELREHWDTTQTWGQGLDGGAAWSWELDPVTLMGSFQLGVFYDQAAGVPVH